MGDYEDRFREAFIAMAVLGAVLGGGIVGTLWALSKLLGR